MNEDTSKSSGDQAKYRWLWILLASLILITFLYFNWPFGPHQPGVGQIVDQLMLEPLTGNSQSVRADDLGGKVVLINFWGTWCPPCREEFPHLANLQGRYAAKTDFLFLSVSCPYFPGESLEDLRVETQQYLDQYRVSFPTHADPGGRSLVALTQIAGQPRPAFPSTVVLDGNRVIRGFWRGYTPGDELQMERVVLGLLRDASR